MNGTLFHSALNVTMLIVLACSYCDTVTYIWGRGGGHEGRGGGGGGGGQGKEREKGGN